MDAERPLLSRAQRRVLESLWHRWLDGEDEARAAWAGAPEAAGLSTAWRAGLDFCFEILHAWREEVAGNAEARTRVVEALFEGVAGVHLAVVESGDHPGRSALVEEVSALAALPPSLFLPLVPEVVPRMVEAIPELRPDLRILAEVVEGLPGDLFEDAAPSSEEERIEHVARLAVAPPPPSAAPVVDEDTEEVDQAARADAVQALVVGRWRRALTARVEAWERETVEALLGEVALGMLQKRGVVTRLRRLLGVQLEYLGLGGTWGKGVWAERTFAALEEYAALAESNPAVARLAEMLGRYEAERTVLEHREVEHVVERPARVMIRGGSDEVKGVHFSGQFERATTGELGLLAEPELEILFFLRLLQNELLTFELTGAERETKADVQVRLEPARAAKAKGPIILCIDTSASMAGEPELVAKTISLAMLRTALRERRPCWAISYSHTQDLREQDLSRFPDALGDLLGFLSMGFRGGTDPVPALQAAIRRLETETFERADILWVTDGVFAVPEPFVAHLRAVRAEKNVKVHTLLVGRAVVPEFVDYCWEWTEGRSFATGGIQLIYGLSDAA